MSNYADINKISSKTADTHHTEVHTNCECTFKREIYRKISDGTTVYVLFRICVCRRKLSRQNKIAPILSENDFGDGVEGHLSGECKYDKATLPDGSIQLRKICRCSRDI